MLDWQPSHVIYTWLQVNGVSVTDPSLPDLLFLLMSASLDSFFIFTLLSSEQLFPSVSSLLKEKKKLCPPSLSLSLSHLLVFFFSSLSHTPTYHLYHWQAAAHPTCCLLWSQGYGVINHMIRWLLLQTWLSGSRRKNLYRGR